MTVFYRKYRPQRISELDSESIKKRIFDVLSSNRIPHAFLLTGPRGLGKTSTARIIAKSVNCLDKDKSGEPCGKCIMCESISSGVNLDVFEMDGASNRGIDEIRDLREKVKLAPSSAKYKVYIIDEVHMLTNEAFNALLKTLEEPPSHAIFILCTTDLQKLPETIISRCMRFEFHYPSKEELILSLKRAVIGEKLEIEDEALLLIAEGAKGSFRDGQKILDQLSFEKKKISHEMVSKLLTGDNEGIDDIFFEFLLKKDTGRAIEWLHEKADKGINLKGFTEKILSTLHSSLLKKTTGILLNEDQINPSLEKFSVNELRNLILLFSKAYLDMKQTFIPELPLELLIIEWGEDKPDQNQDKDSDKITEILKSRNTDESSKKNDDVTNDKDIDARDKKKSDAKVNNTEEKEKSDELPSLLSNEKIVMLWPKILQKVKPFNHSVEALLRSSRPLVLEEECLTIEVFYKFHKERLEQPKVLELLSETISEVLGVKIRVKCILGEKKISQKNVKNPTNDLMKTAEDLFEN